LLEWINEADFTKEINIIELCEHPFELNAEEEDIDLSGGHLLKIIKM